MLDQAHIYAIPYKGPLFALHTYGHIAHRQFGDLDLLMDERDYARGRNHLLQHGFRLAAEYDWECTLMHTQQGYALDIHKALTPSNFPIRLNMSQLKNRLVEQSAQAGPIRALNAEDMLLILCIQLAKDAWAHAFKPVQLAKLCDIAALTRNHPDLDWARVYKRARAIGCIRIVAVALSVSRRLLGALTEDVPEFQSGDAKNALVDDVVRKLTREPKAVGEGDLAPRRFHFLIRERWRDKLAPRYHDLAQRIPPNERDHAFLPLPPQLAIFYWVIRPVRLLRDSSRQAMRFLRERALTGRKPPHP